MTLPLPPMDASKYDGIIKAIRDLGFPVKRVVEIVATHPDRAVIKREYPQLEDDDIAQALCYAASMVDRAVCWLR